MVDIPAAGRILTTWPHPAIRMASPVLMAASRRRLPPEGLHIEPDPIGRLLASGRSLIRWGDGETRVLLGGDIVFQRSHPSLRRTLLRILTTPADEPAFELGLPAQPFLPEPAFRALRQPRVWRETRRTLPLFLDPDRLATGTTIESHSFRTSSETGPGQQPLDPAPLLGGTGRFVLVASEKVIERTRQAFPEHDIRTVAIPPKDAYASLPDTLAELDRIYTTRPFDERTPTIVSAGPAGKALVHARSGRWTLYDLGHFHVHLATT